MKTFIKKYKLDESTWTYKGFHGILHTFFPVGQTGFPMKKFFGDSAKITLFFVKNNYTHWYWNDDDLTRVRNLFLKRIKSNPKYLKNLETKWQIARNIFDKVIAKVERIDLSSLSDKKLLSLYKEFYDKYLAQFSYFMVLGDAVSMHADRYLIPEFQKILGKDFPDVFLQLISTSHVSFLEEEQRSRKKLVEKFKFKKLTEKDLDDHAKKFFYIKNNYAVGQYLTGKDFLKMIRDDSKKRNNKEAGEKISSIKRKALEKKYKPSSWQKTLIYIMDEFFGIQDMRKKYVLISNYYQFEFLKEAARRGGLPFDSLKYSIFPEFEAAVKGKLDKRMLENRKKTCACLQTPKGHEVIIGKEAVALLNHFLTSGDKTKELSGIIASKGRAKGRAKIVLTTHDMVNMRNGDILIASMTRPEMMAAIKKAAAIVTDEGWVTCHAAIVAREMKIPCVIGAKNATRILKDGDLVEVDAEKGIIKILD